MKDCPHAEIIGKWQAAGLDSSAAESLRFLDFMHTLEMAHLERIRALFLRVTEDSRWDAFGDFMPAPGERLPLSEALRALPVDEALAFFEQNDLFDLYRREAIVTAVLADSDTPFYTLPELAITTEHALRCLERNRKYLLEYGHAMTDFQRCRFLS